MSRLRALLEDLEVAAAEAASDLACTDDRQHLARCRGRVLGAASVLETHPRLDRAHGVLVQPARGLADLPDYMTVEEINAMHPDDFEALLARLRAGPAPVTYPEAFRDLWAALKAAVARLRPGPPEPPPEPGPDEG